MENSAGFEGLQTSGDIAADRRFDYALQLAQRGDHAAAIDLLHQSLALAPDWPPAYFQLGLYHHALAQRDAAIAAFRDYLRLDPTDRMGAAIELSLLGAMPVPDQLPPGYVSALFDQYAPRFDRSLVEQLEYDVPQKLHAMIAGLLPMTENSMRILDLGCGTGLAGERFARTAACLHGIDMSEGMIRQAAAKQIYTQLQIADLTHYLAGESPQPYDLILAADVFVYMGALDDVFARLKDWLAPGGLFAFSVQKEEGGDFILGADHRFSHSRLYIERQIAGAGLTVQLMREESLRKDGERRLPGFLAVAQREAAAGTGIAKIGIGTGEKSRFRRAG